MLFKSNHIYEDTYFFSVFLFKLLKIFVSKMYLFERHNDRDRERDTERDLPSTGSHPKCLQQSRLGQL